MKRLFALLTLALMTAIQISSCGGGGGGGTPCGACLNVAGTWATTEQVSSTTCDTGIYTESGIYTVAQAGCALTVQDASGNTFSGSISGSQITWSGSYPEAGGTTSITSMTLNVAADGLSFSGTCEWTWSGAGSTCSGSTSVTGALVSGGGGDTTAPTVPTGLTATAVSPSQIDLSWSASTDNVGVAGYKVYRGGVYLKTAAGTTASDTGLSPATQYCYTVAAVDAAGNESQQSALQCTTTQTGGGGGDGGGTTLEIGPAGGTLTFANGVKLVFPVGAVDTPTVITIEDLPAAQIDAILSNPAMVSTRTKRFLGGFSAKPDGLTFKAPVEAWIPVLPLDPYVIPVQLNVRLNEGTYRYSSSSLEYDGSLRMVKLELQHFSDETIAGLSPEQFDKMCSSCGTFDSGVCEAYDPLQPACCMLPRATRASCASAAGCDCCREKRMIVTTTDTEFVCGECQILGSTITITYPDCPGSPTETYSISEKACEDMSLELTITPPVMDLPINQVKTFSATVTGMGGTETVCQDVPVFPVWNSDEPSVADFPDQSGNIRGNAISLTPVTVRARVGGSSGLEATASVNVVCEGCTMTIQAATSRLKEGESLPLSVLVRDGQGGAVDVPPMTLSWTSSDPQVASLMQTTGVAVTLQAVAAGTTTVTATYQDVKVQISAELSVTVGSPVDIDVYLSREGSKVLCPGRTVKLVAEVVDGNTGLPYEGCAVEWSSSDSSIASVVGGVVTAGGPGRASITASCGGAKRTVSIKVVYNDPLAGELGHRCFLVTVTGMALDPNYPGESCSTVGSQGTASVSGRSLGFTGYGGYYSVTRPPNAAIGAEEGYAIFDLAGLHDMFTESYNPYYDDYAHLYNIRRNWTAQLGADMCEFSGYYDWYFYGPVDSCAGRNWVILTPVDFIIEGGDPFYFCE